eukprot:258606-Amphidinium_carterae.1
MVTSRPCHNLLRHHCPWHKREHMLRLQLPSRNPLSAMTLSLPASHDAGNHLNLDLLGYHLARHLQPSSCILARNRQSRSTHGERITICRSNDGVDVHAHAFPCRMQ